MSRDKLRADVEVREDEPVGDVPVSPATFREPPLIKGGQGRTCDELRACAVAVVFAIALIALPAVAIWLVAS